MYEFEEHDFFLFCKNYFQTVFGVTSSIAELTAQHFIDYFKEVFYEKENVQEERS